MARQTLTLADGQTAQKRKRANGSLVPIPAWLPASEQCQSFDYGSEASDRPRQRTAYAIECYRSAGG